MARVIALTVRVTEDEAEFLEHLGEASFHGKTTVAYIGVRDYLECHGFKRWIAERDATLSTKKRHR